MSEESSESIEVAIDGLSQVMEYGLSQLGNAQAFTGMGAIEAHGLAIRESGDRIAEAIEKLAEVIREKAF